MMVLLLAPGPLHPMPDIDAMTPTPDPAPIERVVAPQKLPVESEPVTSGSAYWIAVAACETGGGDPNAIDWDYNGPSGFDGGLQFLPSTWTANGGGDFAPYAWGATPAEQMIVAERTQAGAASDPWPNCP